MAVVVLAAIAPLALLGAWLTGTASRQGEELVRERLQALMATSSGIIGSSWLSVRAQLLDLAESPEAQARLGGDVASQEPPDPRAEPAMRGVRLLDLSDRPVWSAPGGGADATGPVLRVRIPVHRGRSSERIGTIETQVDVGVLLGSPAAAGLPVGTVLGAVDPATGSTLLPIPFDRALLRQERFRWAGDEWITRRRTLHEPHLELVAAAPVTPLVEPFERAAGQGLLLLAAVAAVSLILTAAMTGVMTRSLARLGAAADAVARGELAHRVEPLGDDEIGRVAEAFNTMTTSLRETLRELSDRQALAAVGEFAASLSHEIRNALSSIRLDLQVSGERLPEDPLVREPQERALREIARLEETVSGALELARSGSLELVAVDLRGPLRHALAAARPEIEKRGCRLDGPDGDEPIRVAGDPAALEQLFLNLLLNAAQATGEGGRVAVRVGTDATSVQVAVRDDGPGMAPDVLERAFDAFYSTRPDGSGLGLSIARRIVRVHGGRLAVETEAGAGTSVEVTLPLPGSPVPTRAGEAGDEVASGDAARRGAPRVRTDRVEDGEESVTISGDAM